jgi:hypothetical protein
MSSNLFPRPDSFPEINYGSEILLLGSCFSNAVGEKLIQAGFRTEINPFGVVFHPLALAKQLANALNNDISGSVFQNNDVYLHSLASSEVYGLSKESLLENYNTQLLKLREYLRTTDVLILTFGSMHGYWLNETGELVANCHKQPGSLFTKKCSEIDEVVSVWNKLLPKLKAVNPKLKIIFTVSPVRYTRDGIMENTLSKSRLIEIIYQLKADYFPSFELINDVLRDFSYFETDKSHPNKQSVEVVWELFRDWIFSESDKEIYKLVAEIRTREAHKFLFPDSVKSEEFRKITQEKREQLNSLFPFVVFL